MPLITCEMRWFFEGVAPGEVERWFGSGPLQAEPWREDRYLVLPGVIDMGIKAREGRIEIKGRSALLGGHAIAHGIEGVAERWCKWSYDVAIEARLHGLLQDHGVSVAKARAQRHFVLAAGSGAQEVPLRDPTRRGFSLELTRLRRGGASHWTFGIEAAPDDPTLLGDLLPALRDVLRGFPLPLPRTHAWSYPAWLTG